MKKLSRRVVKEVTERYEVNENIVLVVKTTGKKVTKSLVHKKNKEMHPTILKRGFKKYIEKNNPFYSACWKEFQVDLDKYDLDKIKKEDIYFLYFSGHILFDADETPISIPIASSSSDFTDEDYDLVCLYNHFKKSKYVISLTKIQRESYDDGNYLNATFKIDQKIYEKFYKEAKIEDKEFWSVRLKEKIIPKAYMLRKKNEKYYGKNIDFLKIRKFVNEEKD